MNRNLAILLAAAVVIALPFLFRQEQELAEWRPGDPELIIITPHNEAIRHEFANAFSAWHQKHHGQPVKVDWRAIGGTTEISRYLQSEYITAMRAWWKGQGKPWPNGASEAMVDRRFNTKAPPSDDPGAVERWEQMRDIYLAFRAVDNPDDVTSRIDLFFGGGVYDHDVAKRQGMTVAPWTDETVPAALFKTDDGVVLIPEEISGETWRTDTLFGTALSTFGICYNIDRLADLGITEPPSHWTDLTDPRYVGQLGVSDPTKSGSIAKAFELIIHEQCHRAVEQAGFSLEQSLAFEEKIAQAKLPPGVMPPEVPQAYQDAVEAGWFEGLKLVQLIGANARYFTDSSSKVPIDVSMGNAAVGIAIDFYGRFQAQTSIRPDGTEPMVYTTPTGGSGVSCDPISLLRGAPSREIAVRFIEFVLGTEGQCLWTYRAGTPGGPEKFSLRRIPIRRDFFPSDNPAIQAAHKRHLAFAADDLADPRINPYALADEFHYIGRWTGRHFGIHRDLIRAMCLDSGKELREAWRAIIANGGPEQQPEAMALLARMPDIPEPLNWTDAPTLTSRYKQIDLMRDWTLFFRNSYREARDAVVPRGAASREKGTNDHA